jgi:hypothetical protein
MLSSKAGGYELYLISASMMFYPDWNLGNDKQAIARIKNGCLPSTRTTLIIIAVARVWQLSKHLQQAINNLLKWTQTSSFTFSPEKSQCIVFTRKLNQNSIKIKINDRQLINNNT